MSELEYLKTNKKYLFDGCKMFWHQDRLQDFLNGKRVMPIHIDMGIHKSCNIKCVYCYGVKQKKSPKFIPEDRLLLMADDAAACGVRSIGIIGDGEPTMNKGLYAFVQRLKKNNVDCAVATNGLLLTDDNIDILTKCLTWLRFNISAVSKYEQIMGAPKGSFAKFERIVKYAVAHKKNCTIGLQMVLIPDCFDQVILLAKKAVEWGVDYLVIKQFSDGGKDMPTHMNMDDYDQAMAVLKQAEGMSNNKTSIIVKWNAINDTKNITKNKRWDFDRCIDLPFLFQISGDGGCYACGYLFGDSNFCYGNVIEQRLKDILVSDKYWDIIKKVAEIPLEELCEGQCRHCESLKFLDRVTKLYKGNLEECLIELCGGQINYIRLINNPPLHRNFL